MHRLCRIRDCQPPLPNLRSPVRMTFRQSLTAYRLPLTVALFLLLGVSRATAQSAQAEYVLQPMDLVKVEVFQEPDMERQVRISQDSTISLPLINRVDLKGKTVQQA